MALSYKARRRWSLFLLLVWMPAYIIGAVAVMSQIDRPPVWIEVPIYVILGIAWAVPFRFIFRGIGKPDPDADPPPE